MKVILLLIFFDDFHGSNDDDLFGESDENNEVDEITRSSANQASSAPSPQQKTQSIPLGEIVNKIAATSHLLSKKTTSTTSTATT
jgi:hypothetical protein